MSSPAAHSESSAAPRRRRAWWIAAGVLALFAVLAYRFAEPIYGTVSFMTGNPYLPGCATTAPSEGTIGLVWYRISEQHCANGTAMHYVFVAPASSRMSFMVTPAFMSVDSPVPVSVGQSGDRTYFITIKPPLADGTDFLEITVGPSGVPLGNHIFYRGQRRETP